jgi:hypothetical protein
MESPDEIRRALERIVDQLGDTHEGTRKHRADLVLRAIQLRCALARAEGEIIAPAGPSMRCVVHESAIGGLCPHCPAALPLPEVPPNPA